MADFEYSPNTEVGFPVASSNSLIADFAFRTPKLDEFEDILRNTVTEHRLTPASRGTKFEGEFGFSGWSDFSVFNTRFRSKLEADLAPEESDDRIGFAMAVRGSNELVMRGKEYSMSGSQGVTFTSGPPRTLRFSDESDGLGLIMNRHRIAEYCAKLLGRDIEGHVQFETHFDLDSPAGQSWLRLVRYTSTEISNPLSLVRQFAAARQQLEQMVITGFLLSHRHIYSIALHQPQPAAAPYYVKRAEAYIEAHFTYPLSLADIAAQSGVSARSLQTGFQNFRHMTPMAYLRSVRLRHAHQALLTADPALSTVTDIALFCGFNHMGEFSALYKRTYGVTPRQTLLKKLKA
jgi:AraC-like DNA-binding protein